MRVLLTGGSGMVGGALLRLAPAVAPGLTLLAPTRGRLDLTDRAAVARWFAANRVDAVIHAAARVGGIQANIDDPSGFLLDNLRMNDAVIAGADDAGVGRLVFLGSSCMYPRDYRQPLVEDDVLAEHVVPVRVAERVDELVLGVVGGRRRVHPVGPDEGPELEVGVGGEPGDPVPDRLAHRPRGGPRARELQAVAGRAGAFGRPDGAVALGLEVGRRAGLEAAVAQLVRQREAPVWA